VHTLVAVTAQHDSTRTAPRQQNRRNVVQVVMVVLLLLGGADTRTGSKKGSGACMHFSPMSPRHRHLTPRALLEGMRMQQQEAVLLPP
jgi:hypothetical protein